MQMSGNKTDLADSPSPTIRSGAQAAVSKSRSGRQVLRVARFRPSWARRVHSLLGVVSALNLLLLISTGLLLQHASVFHLDEHTVTRHLLPASYRLQDGTQGVRADIVVTDVHSGRLLGTAGALFLDGITLLWLVMLATGLLMHYRRRSKQKAVNGGDESNEDI